jgi:Peptidase family M23
MGLRAMAVLILPAAGLALLGGGPVDAASRRAEPVPVTRYQLPFTCEQAWSGGLRARHSPSRNAIDFNRTADEGKPVVAAAAGVVVTANATGRYGYGRYVVIDHGNGESSLYAHLKKVVVKAGSAVDQGVLLGIVGSTGNSTAPHLHFEQKVGRQVVPAYFSGLPFSSSTLSSTNCADVPLAANTDGDRVAEVGVFRRTQRASFIVQPPGGVSLRVVPFGVGTDEPVLGDWNADGYADPGVWSPRGRLFKLSTPAGVVSTKFGMSSDRPVAGDWDGDGTWEVGVFRPSRATFLLRAATGAVTSVVLGNADDVPVTGDWNADGRTDVGVFDRATAVFTLHHVDASALPVTSVVQFGYAGDLPVVGDWDGNGSTELGTWTPATAVFNQRQAPDAAGAARPVAAVQFGNPR